MLRNFTPAEADDLPGGELHYRAYVGPPKRYGLLTLIQMNLLAALGLEETDRVLDFGCGSLRLGRSLIPSCALETTTESIRTSGLSKTACGSRRAAG